MVYVPTTFYVKTLRKVDSSMTVYRRHDELLNCILDSRQPRFGCPNYEIIVVCSNYQAQIILSIFSKELHDIVFQVNRSNRTVRLGCGSTVKFVCPTFTSNRYSYEDVISVHLRGYQADKIIVCNVNFGRVHYGNLCKQIAFRFKGKTDLSLV